MLEEQTVKAILCDNCRIKLADVSNVVDGDFIVYCKKCEAHIRLNQWYIPCVPNYIHPYEITTNPYQDPNNYRYSGPIWRINLTA